jgi:hypothetical protein
MKDSVTVLGHCLKYHRGGCTSDRTLTLPTLL